MRKGEEKIRQGSAFASASPLEHKRMGEEETTRESTPRR